MPEALTRIRPLGTFPPQTAARAGGTLDLGALMRDQLLQRRALWGPLRRLLQSRLAQAIEAGQWSRSADLLGMWLQTWPVGAMVDPAVSEWMTRPSPESLAILARASELACAALGWPTVPGLPWPDPPAEWLRTQMAAQDLAAHDLPEDLDAPAEELLPIESIRGEALIPRRAELARRLVRGELGAVQLTSPIPPSPLAALAIGELRMEGRHQRAFEAWGPAGLRVQGFATLAEQLSPAPPGEPGAVLIPTGDCLLAPGIPASLGRAQLETVGWLVWEAPFRPVPVHPLAVEVLRALDGLATLPQLCVALELSEEQIQPVLDALVSVGAATAA